ncbi:MAG TPA: GntR family transcriptional regulator [Solirubrobacteraceae bacterium]|jgi:GntR family transcriptional regulator|nr:GntR family transcriptional regulator [Solirubrobacteraceae bacterium]
MVLEAKSPDMELEPALLDRTSFVPLYYQLQEVLKERIESGRWQPGDVMPSEPEFARSFGVSRVVVRQALAILEDDRQIVRIKGRGTFVAETKLDARAGGLSRLLATRRPPGVALKVLDVRTAVVEKSIRAKLGCDANVPILRVTTVLSLRGVPLAIAYSFFRRDEVAWLEAAAKPGGNLPTDLVIGDHEVRLARAELSIEASQCGQFEADRFGVPHRSAVFLVLCTEYRLSGNGDDGEIPFEVARVEYRGDLLKFDLEVSPDDRRSIQAVWGLTEQGNGLVARPA